MLKIHVQGGLANFYLKQFFIPFTTKLYYKQGGLLMDNNLWSQGSSMFIRECFSSRALTIVIDHDLNIESDVEARGKFLVKGNVTCADCVLITYLTVKGNFSSGRRFLATSLEADGHVDLGKNSNINQVKCSSITVGKDSIVKEIEATGLVRVPIGFTGKIVGTEKIEYY